MPRKSASAKLISLPSAKLQAPPHLPADERALFASIVAASRPGHFVASDTSLLEEFVANLALNAKAHSALRVEPIVDGRPSPWLTIAEKTNRAVVALSLRLRLSPQARAPNTKTQRSEVTQPSVYDIMRMTTNEHTDD
jgi:hypothetical protein